MDEITENLAKNLKFFRVSERVSLDEVSDRTGVSKSMLRQIENGESSPSISIVWKIANGLKRSFTSLIEPPRMEYEVTNYINSTPMTECNGGYRLFPIFPYDPKTGFESYYIEIDSQTEFKSEGHNGGAKEYLILYQGELELEINGEIKIIKKNNAINFDATFPHGYANRKKELVKITMIIYYEMKT